MIKEGKMPFRGGETYYRIVNPTGKKTPLLLLHGGPGSTHNYFEVFDELAKKDDRPLVMYDQIGCGESFIEGDEKLFNADVWKEELIALREYLGLKEVHILGQSWGGMLAILYALDTDPQGVKSYILSSTLSSAKLWREEQYRRIGYMPAEIQRPLMEAERTGDYSSPEYEKALELFMLRYAAGPVTEASPECLRRPRVSGKTSYVVGWGENEFTPTGTLSGYEITDRLHEIRTPCLVTNGQEDLSSPYISKLMADTLPNAKWELFAYSRHMPFVDEHEKYQKVLVKWLNDNDSIEDLRSERE